MGEPEGDGFDEPGAAERVSWDFYDFPQSEAVSAKSKSGGCGCVGEEKFSGVAAVAGGFVVAGAVEKLTVLRTQPFAKTLPTAFERMNLGI